MDVFTNSHFQVKFWSVLNMLSKCLFVSLIICSSISLLVNKRKLSAGKIDQCYFSPLYLLSPGLAHFGHFPSNFSAHKVQE